MTEDEIILLEDAVEDSRGMWESNWTLQDIGRAKSAVKLLYEKGFIEFFFTTKWIGGETSRLTDVESSDLLRKLIDDSYWNPDEDVSKGYYGFGITPKGKEFYKTDESIRAYYKNKSV
ncbi:MAG: hypothetical protein K2X29_05130 [Candidatus Obscuribacterales bacterium]|nr:hypothetical protein [Candidatus Obscuribacterales bacterium]